jgi:fructose-1,6-bisphosphatase/inositol monophosphatase family enzyme
MLLFKGCVPRGIVENMNPNEAAPTHDKDLTREIIIDSLTTVRKVFRGFRKRILERAGNSEYINKQEDNSPVTESDMEIELALQAEMEDLYPDVPVFGEETGYGDDLPDTYWLIDPIDGTKAFIEGIPSFTCMAVLIHNGEAVASEIYNPSLDISYSAQKGEGAYKITYIDDVEHRELIDLSEVPMPSIAFCKEQFASDISDMLRPQGVTAIEAPTGGGFGFTTVLDGIAAARFNLHPGGYTHDYAPGALLVREANGKLWPIRDDPNESFEARSFIACHPGLEFTEEDLDRLRSWEKPLKK